MVLCGCVETKRRWWRNLTLGGGYITQDQADVIGRDVNGVRVSVRATIDLRLKRTQK